MSSGGGKTTVGYWYRLLYHFGLVKGPIDAFLEFRAGDRTAWKGLLTQSGRITVNAKNLWGGEKSEGGLQGEMDIMMGEPTQGPNDYLATHLGADQPSYRGKLSAVWRGGRWGAMNPYPKPAAFKVRRILKGWDNDECWYPERAVIPLIPTDPLALYFAVDLSGSMNEVTPNGSTRLENMIAAVTSVFELIREVVLPIVAVDIMVVGWGGTIASYLDRVSITRRNASATDIDDIITWLEARTASYNTFFPSAVEDAPAFFAGTASGYVPISLFITDGNPTLPSEVVPPLGPEAGPEAASVTLLGIPDLRAWGFNIDLSDTSYTAMLDNTGNDGVPVVASDDPSALTNAIFEAIGGLLAMNPIHILYDSLTAQDMQGEPVGMINDASFRAAADRLFSEAFGLCMEYKGEPVDEFQQRICDVIGASMTQSRTDGQYYVDLIRGDYDLESLPVIEADDIVEFSIEPSVLTEQINQITVEWFDPQNKVERSTAPLQALGAIQAAGRVNPDTRSYPELAAEFLALRVAARDLQAESTPLSRLKLTVNRRPFDMRPGRQFRLQYPVDGIADMVCLLGDIDGGTLLDGRIRVIAIQDVYGMPQTVYVTPEPGLAEPPDETPVASPHQLLLEAPYVELTGNLSNADLAALPIDAGALMTVATRASNGLNYSIYSAADGEEYADNGGAEWCPSALMVEAAGYLDTAFTLAGGTDLDDVEVGTWALWDDEIVRIDALDVDAGTLSLGRGCADTVPAQHAAGSRIYFAGDWAGTDGREYVDGDTVRAKLLTRTSSAELALGSATELSLVMDQRQYRPYPPGRLRLNGEAYPDVIHGDVEVAFAHRDRLLQGDKLFDTEVGDIGPEPGTTYELEVRDRADNSLAYSTSGSSGPFAILSDDMPNLSRLLVYAVRGGLRSWQALQADFTHGATLWTPAEIATALWLDASDASTLTVSGGVSEWRDKSGNARHFASPSGKRPSVLSAELNGRNVIRFNGVDQYMNRTSNFFALGSVLCLMVMKYRTASGAANRFALAARNSGAGTSKRFYINWAANTTEFVAAAGSTAVISNSGLSDTDWHVQECSVLAGTQKYYVDGAERDSDANSQTDAPEVMALGGLPASDGVPTANFGDVDIAEVVFVTSATHRQTTEGYLAHKWGLSGQLPVGHPSKDSAPTV